MKTIYKLTLIFLSVIVTSCGNFLDVNPKAEVIDKDMFNNKQGCEDAVMGLYGELKTNMLYGERWNWGVFDVLSQDFNVGDENYKYLREYNYNDAQKFIDGMWIEAYRVIGYANNIINNLEAKTDKFPLHNLYVGEALGVRAMLHFDLVRAFAPHVERNAANRGIPYATQYSFKHTEFSTVGQVYDFIIKDLKAAQTLLQSDEQTIVFPREKDENIKQAFNKGRQMHFNYYAATALLARVLWTKGAYAEARIEALKVINSGKFPLAEKDEITTLIAGSLAVKETIWGVYSTSYINITKERLNTGNSWSSSVPYQSALGGNYPMPYNMVYSQYLGENAGVDSRLTWFRPAIEGGKTSNCLKVVDKLLIESDTDTPARRGLYDGISLLRIPEMYYIVAESYLRESGNTGEALKYINKVMLSRGLTALENRNPAIVPDLGFLYNERHKELYCEGQRWFDMKKLNDDIISNYLQLTIPASDKIYVLPIPLAEFENRN